MAWTVILEDEKKEIISTLSSEFDVSLNDEAGDLKLLCYLDPYGDTFFNHLQMDDLIRDLQTLKLRKVDPLLDEIQILAELCSKEEHTYLAFYGD